MTRLQGSVSHQQPTALRCSRTTDVCDTRRRLYWGGQTPLYRTIGGPREEIAFAMRPYDVMLTATGLHDAKFHLVDVRSNRWRHTRSTESRVRSCQ